MNAEVVALDHDVLSQLHVQLPTFSGRTYDDHVKAWQRAHAATQYHQWELGAVAASLTRDHGGSPRRQAAMQQTLIQRFCSEVGVDRQTFHRLSHTYKTFSQARHTGGTRFISELSFKHFEVASRLAKDDPVAAVTEAHERGWSANELQRQLDKRKLRQLQERKSAAPFVLLEAVSKLVEINRREIASWPSAAREKARMLMQDGFEELLDGLMAPTPASFTKADLHAIRWIKAELETFPFTTHTFNEIPVGRGGSFEIVPGAAGAPIFHTIIGDASRASRERVLVAVNNLLAGRVTPLGKRVAEVAREIAEGRLEVRGLMRLPPDAGGDVRGTLFEYDGTLFERPGRASPVDDLPQCLSELTASDDDDPIGLREEAEMETVP